MKRLLFSLLFGVFFQILYMGLILILILGGRYFLSISTNKYFESMLGYLSMPVTWLVVVVHLFSTNGYSDLKAMDVSPVWVFIANFVLYSILFYLVLWLISRFKKSNKNGIKEPPLPPQFN